MTIIAQGTPRLLVKMPADVDLAKIMALASRSLGLRSAGDMSMTPIGHVMDDHQWHAMAPPPTPPMHPWDMAHSVVRAAAALQLPAKYVEPDILQAYSPAHPWLATAGNIAAAISSAVAGPLDLDTHWPPSAAANAPPAWHLLQEFSALKPARDAVGDPPLGARRVRVAHLDTGYSETHETLPKCLRRDLARNFVEHTSSAVDPADYHGLLENPGHGTKTLGLLAGNICSLTNDYLGGAPFAEIVPVRIADSVVHFFTSAIAEGINYATSSGCDVVSLSMGGVPAQSWADAVNDAYDRGCCMFAASGDNIGGLPTHYTVYPARFRRVVAVCGVDFAREPYYANKYTFQKVLEGNFGPDSAMSTAIAAFTPNVLGALIKTAAGYTRGFGGTSASTPQAAAAAALYIQKHLDQLKGLAGWQKVEFVRAALFTGARPAKMDYFGNGLLQADVTLSQTPIVAQLTQQPVDTIEFALLKELFGWDALSPAQQAMMSVEATQLIAAVSDLEDKMQGTNESTRGVGAPTLKAAVEALLNSRMASSALTDFLTKARGAM